MRTAVDTNVLLDVFLADPVFGQRSKQALRESLQRGSLLACEVVWAEVSGQFPSAAAGRLALENLGVAFSVQCLKSVARSGEAWKTYRARGGSRQRVIADFLIGAHALEQADRLLTRDSGYFRTYFPDLTLVDPSET